MQSRDEQRAAECERYERCYNHPTSYYGMGNSRMKDAVIDLKWARKQGCTSYFDIGCGRGEMLDHAEHLGFVPVRGAEVVKILCEDERVAELHVHELHKIPDEQFHLVTSFDVIEHLLPVDDELLIVEMGRIAMKCLALTANNRPSIDPPTQTELHINKRPYEEWDQIIRDILEPDWSVERLTGKRYVSETWRAWR